LSWEARGPLSLGLGLGCLWARGTLAWTFILSGTVPDFSEGVTLSSVHFRTIIAHLKIVKNVDKKI
jgi:hypothetical protein